MQSNSYFIEYGSFSHIFLINCKFQIFFFVHKNSDSKIIDSSNINVFFIDGNSPRFLTEKHMTLGFSTLHNNKTVTEVELLNKKNTKNY